jgi:AraC-like DNA-binding protein
MPLSYHEVPPPRDLASWVACFWQIKGEPARDTTCSHRVLPDGCADLIFDFQAVRQAVEGGFVGPMSHALVVNLQGLVDLLGVRLRPGAVGKFAGIPAHELLDLSAPLTELSQVLQIDVAAFEDDTTMEARIHRLTQLCRKRIADLATPDPLVRYAMTYLMPSAERESTAIAVLVRDLGLSERAFQRRFMSQVGLTPVCFRRLARVRSVLRAFAGGARDWSAAAANTGFSDQSHLVREWQAFVGLSPTQWAATQGQGAGFLQDGQITAL